MSTALNPFSGTDVWQLLLQRATTRAGEPFVIWQPFDAEPQTTTYAQLARRSARMAVGLAARGVRRGDRVLVHLENCPEFLVTWFACTALGAVAVTTNTRASAEELAHYARDSQALGVVTQPRFAALVASAVPWLRFLVTTDHDSGRAGNATDGEPVEQLLGDPDDLPDRPVNPMAELSVQYTSGTTSLPKGVLWTHANGLWGARVNAAHEHLRPTDRHLVYMPLFHTNALAYSMLATLWVGGALVLVPKWSTSRFWDVSLRHGCTWLPLIGMTIRIMHQMEPVPGHRYRHFGTGNCDLRIDSAYGVKTIGWWGMTETISHPVIGDAYLPNRYLSMGRPAAEYEVRVVREDGVSAVQPEEPGELLVRGTPGVSLFAGYLNDPLRSPPLDAGGWFHTGDVVVPHADGHLSFSHRSKDMLKVGAENVAAAEVEQVILGVRGVSEVAVVGRPDDKLDEVPVAFVMAHGSSPDLEEQVIAACRARLADFKVPRAVYRVRQMPRSTLNKITKSELRAVAGPDADRDGAEQRWIQDAEIDPSGDAS